MLRSLRLLIIVRVFICVFIFVLLNRFAAPYAVKDFITDSITIELREVITKTNVFTSNTIDFQLTNPKVFHGFQIRTLIKCSAYYKVYDSICPFLSSESVQWQKIGDEVTPTIEPLIEFAIINVGKKSWGAVRKENHGSYDYLAFDRDEIDDIIDFVWSVRNRILRYYAPLLVLFSLAVGLYLSSYIISLLNDVQMMVGKTDAANLEIQTNSQAYFKEFQSFINVFESLKVRLKNSFDQTSRFSSNASHELKKPLTILRGHAEQGLKIAKDGSPEQMHFAVISEQVNQLIGITDRLLLLAKADANSLTLNLTDVNISNLFKKIIEDASLLRPDLVITQKIEDNIRWNSDEYLIQQLIVNLFSNAMKYASQNGWIHFVLRRKGSQVHLEINNSAINIPHDLNGKAFDRFYRGHEIGSQLIEGSGLGLSLCKEIAKVHDAFIHLDTDEDKSVRAVLAFKTISIAAL